VVTREANSEAGSSEFESVGDSHGKIVVEEEPEVSL
jgi:hypothetical protein